MVVSFQRSGTPHSHDSRPGRSQASRLPARPAVGRIKPGIFLEGQAMATRAALAVFIAFLVVVPARAADDDEPEFLDIKLSEWIKRLHEGKTALERRRGAFGVENVGHSRSRKVIPALVKA